MRRCGIRSTDVREIAKLCVKVVMQHIADAPEPLKTNAEQRGRCGIPDAQRLSGWDYGAFAYAKRVQYSPGFFAAIDHARSPVFHAEGAIGMSVREHTRSRSDVINAPV
jgi:hypothetical protein